VKDSCNFKWKTKKQNNFRFSILFILGAELNIPQSTMDGERKIVGDEEHGNVTNDGR
jgi:hypothetical protein